MFYLTGDFKLDCMIVLYWIFNALTVFCLGYLIYDIIRLFTTGKVENEDDYNKFIQSNEGNSRIGK